VTLSARVRFAERQAVVVTSARDARTVASSPWSTEDLIRWLVITGAGAGACMVGWWAASGHARFDDQIAAANIAVGGLVVASCAHVGWIMRLRRVIGDRRRDLLGEPAAVVRRAPETSAADVIRSRAEALVAGDGLRWYHRASCPLVQGRDWPTRAESEHRKAGRRPCAMCQP
jgi:hypothetical protein